MKLAYICRLRQCTLTLLNPFVHNRSLLIVNGDAVVRQGDTDRQQPRHQAGAAKLPHRQAGTAKLSHRRPHEGQAAATPSQLSYRNILVKDRKSHGSDGIPLAVKSDSKGGEGQKNPPWVSLNSPAALPPLPLMQVSGSILLLVA